jgi:uncharacterized membrane protein
MEEAMINCPKCKSGVTKPGRYCVTCGHDFGGEIDDRLTLYFGMREEFEQISSMQRDMSSALVRMSQKLQRFEEILMQDMASAVYIEGKSALPQETPIEAEHPRGVPQVEKQDMSSDAILRQHSVTGQKKSDFEIKLGQKWLLIVGILTMVFGVGYFLKYSFEQGWVTPAGRVAMAYVWGIIFVVAGNRFRKRNFEVFGLSLTGGGIAVLYFATFAAFQIYHLFGQAPSFGIMVLITILAVALAIIYDTKWLGVLGMTGGFLTPILLSTSQDNQIVLMSYMTILNLGLLSIAFSKEWSILNTLGFIFTYLLYSIWYSEHYTDGKFWPAIIFLNIFFLTYSIAPFAYQFFRERRRELKGIVIMSLNSLFAFGYSYAMIRGRFSLPWVSVVSVFYSIVFVSLATVLYKRGAHQRDAFVIFLAKALLFLIITVPLIFSQHWITIFWAAQALSLLWMGTTLNRRSLAGGAYLLLGITLVKFLFYDYFSVFSLDTGYLSIRGTYTNLLPERWLTEFFVLLTVYGQGALAKRSSLNIFSLKHADAEYIFGVWAGLLFIVLNVELASFFHDYLPQARFAALSVLWTLFSVGLMLKGFRDNKPLLRRTSFGLFLVTTGKVFLFDIADFSTPYRIISFIFLGIVLVGISYLYFKYKDRIINVMTEHEAEERKS